MLKAWSLLLTVLAAIAVGYVVALANWLHIPLAAVIPNALFVIKLFFPILLLAGLVVLVMGALQLVKGRRADASPFLTIMTFLAPLAGLAPAAYGLMVTKIVIDQTHTTNFRVYAPSIVEALMPLALGLSIGAVAGLSNILARPASRR
jgi:hypothetical protein